MNLNCDRSFQWNLALKEQERSSRSPFKYNLHLHPMHHFLLVQKLNGQKSNMFEYSEFNVSKENKQVTNDIFV